MHWAVAHTHPREEDRVIWHAGMLGFDCYCPKIRFKKRRPNGTFSVRYEPLFPRYVFISVDDFWYRILSLYGVSRVIMNQQRPAYLHDRFVKMLKNEEDADGFYVPTKFKIGQAVRVEKGVLSGQLGIYDGMLPHERSAVLVQMLGTIVRCSIRETDLVAV